MNLNKLERQEKLEEESLGMGIKRYRESRLPWQDGEKNRTPESELPPGMVQLQRVVEPVSKAIEEWVGKATTGARNGGAAKHAFMAKAIKDMDMDVVAFLVSKRIINSLTQRETLQKVAQGIAQWVIDEKNYLRFKEEAASYAYVINESNKKRTTQRARMAVVRNAMDKAGIEKFDLDLGQRVKLGAALIDRFIEATGMIEITTITVRKNKTINVVTAKPEVLQWMEQNHARCELLSPFHLPMVVKPLNWSSPTNGGYLNKEIMPLRLVKTPDNKYIDDLSMWNMPEVYSAINAIQSTPWRINKAVYEVMKEAWDSARPVGGLPSREPLPLPTKPHDIAENKESLKSWKRLAAPVHAANHRLKGKRISMSQKLWIAEKFIDEKEIFFPCVLDWRSRIYYVPNLVNPQADDTGKALLEFAEGKPLGENGGYWLAVHIANLFGVDKVSLDERVEWVQEHSTEICMSAISPMEYQFWCEADKPYQALAACIEWNGFMQEGNAFVSHLPIAMDGSNNGLQHFSMMMRDVRSGQAVNLVPAEKPEDIYQRVADVVSARVEEDAASGNEIAMKWIGKVDRKICKRPCMTLPYGATQYGMKDQIAEEVRKAAEGGKPIMEQEDVNNASLYLAKVVYSSIGEVVSAANHAMTWLQETARIIASDELPVRWLTPSGFPVVQGYRKNDVKKIETTVGGARIQMKVSQAGKKLDKKKQALGISPNVVHSLDASHLMTTVNYCLDADLHSFAMVHDSYAVHACDTDQMNYLIRRAFVDQYSDDVLADFRQQLINQIPGELAEKIPDLPPQGDLDPELIMDSEYFFA